MIWLVAWHAWRVLVGHVLVCHAFTGATSLLELLCPLHSMSAHARCRGVKLPILEGQNAVQTEYGVTITPKTHAQKPLIRRLRVGSRKLLAHVHTPLSFRMEPDVFATEPVGRFSLPAAASTMTLQSYLLAHPYVLTYVCHCR